MVDQIFRFTNAGDTIGSIGSTEKIEFNTGTVPDSTGRTVQTSFRMSRDTNIHPNPRRVQDQIQDSLLGLTEVTVAGYFTTRATTLGPRNLFNFSVGSSQNTDFPIGRFGLVLDSFSNGLLSLTPDDTPNTFGYILTEIDVQEIEKPRDKVPFIARFYRNGDVFEV